MIDSLRLYSRYIGVSIRSQMEYRASFVMISVAQVFSTGFEFLGIVALFDRFKTIRGWTLPEAALLYGMVHVSFAIAEAVVRGFDQFDHMVKAGDFDRLLLRPRSTVLQLMGQQLELRCGRLVQGIAVLIWAAHSLNVTWTPANLLFLAGSIVGGACLFGGIFVLQATMAFWTIESLEMTNTLTYGGVETAQYPLSIYRPWFRRFFTFVVPLACVNFFPSLAILGRGSSGVTWLAPIVGAAFLALALRVWQFGVRHYCSTGS